MRAADRSSAERTRLRISRGESTPATFRAALTAVPADARDAWLDLVCGIEGVVDDGPELPRGGVPYLPCAVATLLDMVEQARVGPDDVFVDVGSGLGRATALVQLLTGATCIGLEIQSRLVSAARALDQRLKLSRSRVVQGDAVELTGLVTMGTVFFLYCPFSGDRLSKLLDALEVIARARPIRVCCVDLPLPPRRWLTPISPPDAELVVHHGGAPRPPGTLPPWAR